MPVLLYELADDNVTRGRPFEVDLILSVGSSHESTLTDNPVEDGTDITDNQTIKPDGHELEVVVSDRPNDGTYQPGRAKAAWSKMMELMRGRSMLEVILPGLGSRTSVRLHRMNVNFTSATGVEVARIAVSFRQVERKSSRRVPAEKRKETKAKSKTDQGNQSTLPATDEVSEQARTVAAQLIDGAKGLLKKDKS